MQNPAGELHDENEVDNQRETRTRDINDSLLDILCILLSGLDKISGGELNNEYALPALELIDDL